MKKKTKEIKLPVKFNPGTQKYEPELPVRKKEKLTKKEKKKIDRKNLFWILWLLAILILFILLGVWLSNRV